MRTHLFLIASVGLFVSSSVPAIAVVATFNPTADGTMYNGNPTFFSNIISVYNDGGGNVQRGLAQFDLSSFPSTGIIGTATLTITHDSGIWPTGNAGQPTYVSAVTNPWTPGQVGWNDRATATPWTTAGGDFGAPYASYTAGIPDNSGAVRLNFDVKNLVQAWKSGAVTNNGVAFTSAVGNGLHNHGVTSAPVQSYKPTLFINTYSSYSLGEAGTLGASNIPLDVTGNHDMINQIGAPAVDADNAPVAGSTESLLYSGGQGSYSAVNEGTLPSDNFKVSIWAKVAATDVNQSFNPSDPYKNTVVVYSSAGLANNGINIVLNNGFWGAELQGVGYLSDPALAGAAPVVADAWTELTVTRLGGVSTFAVNGVPYGTATNQPTAFGGMHLAVNPGGFTYFRGKLDELTVTFVPEPSSLLLIGVGGFGLLARRRRK